MALASVRCAAISIYMLSSKGTLKNELSGWRFLFAWASNILPFLLLFHPFFLLSWENLLIYKAATAANKLLKWRLETWGRCWLTGNFWRDGGGWCLWVGLFVALWKLQQFPLCFPITFLPLFLKTDKDWLMTWERCWSLWVCWTGTLTWRQSQEHIIVLFPVWAPLSFSLSSVFSMVTQLRSPINGVPD